MVLKLNKCLTHKPWEKEWTALLRSLEEKEKSKQLEMVYSFNIQDWKLQ